MPLKDFDECMRALMGFINHRGVVISWLATRLSLEVQMSTSDDAPEERVLKNAVYDSFDNINFGYMQRISYFLKRPETNNSKGEKTKRAHTLPRWLQNIFSFSLNKSCRVLPIS